MGLNSKTKSSIQIIISATLSMVMVSSLAAYFYVGYIGMPLYIIIRFVFAAIIINSLGLVILANLAMANEQIKKFFHFFLGIFLSIFLILGFLKNSFNSFNEMYLALSLFLLVSGLVILYFETHEKIIKKISSISLVIVFVLLTLVSLSNRPESATVIQDFQVVFSFVALIGLLMLFESIRDFIKKYLKLDFHSPVSLCALIMTIMLLGFSFYVLMVFRNLGGFVNFAAKGMENLISTKIVVYQLLYFIAISFLGVGLFIRRNFRQSLERLGLTLPKLKDWGMVLVFGIGLFLANYLMEFVGAKLNLIDLQAEKEASQAIFQGMSSFSAILILALGAGIGEEILFRGALQPKFGILFTTILFVLLHGQYQLWGLTTVFLLGIILAYQRKISNTTATVISHFLYDLIGLALIFIVK